MRVCLLAYRLAILCSIYSLNNLCVHSPLILFDLTHTHTHRTFRQKVTALSFLSCLNRQKQTKVSQTSSLTNIPVSTVLNELKGVKRTQRVVRTLEVC